MAAQYFKIVIFLIMTKNCKRELLKSHKKEMVLNIEKLFKFKAKVLKKELGLNQATANDLLSKLIGFSSYYEYNKNVESVDGRLEYLKISKNNPTLSNKRIKKNNRKG